MHDIVVRPFVFDFDSAAVAAGRSSDAVDQLNSERPRTSLASPMSRGFGPAMKGKVFTIVPSLRRGLPTSIRLPIRTSLAAIIGHDSLHIGGSGREAYDYEGKPEDAPTQPALCGERLPVTRRSKVLLIRTAAERLALRGRCHPPK